MAPGASSLAFGQMACFSSGPLGIKNDIMYFLKMLRVDAGLLPNDSKYIGDLRMLRNLESKIKLLIGS